MKQIMTLDQLQPGEQGFVIKIHTTDKMKRRFLDLGIIPDTRIEVLYESPFKEPKAYFIRGATIALRKEDAKMIEITRMEESKWV